MRIPSDFNDDNLYRRVTARRGDHAARTRGETTTAYRRIIRLVVGLGLVIVVMKQASQESLYRPFFGGAGSATLAPGTPGGEGLGIETASMKAADAPPLSEEESAALEKVVDGSVWRSGDVDGLYRLLDRASGEQSRGEIPPSAVVGVLPLLQQPDVFRGQSVRFSGTVAKADRMPAGDNPFGITEYWQLWIRPSGGADRPLVAIVGALPTRLAVDSGPAEDLDGLPVTIVGRFFKRLAYRSGAGADLAPVVIGQWVMPAVSDSPVVQEITGDSDQALLPTIAMACLGGLGIAVLAMWRTGAAARRSRELRTAKQSVPKDFLDGLDAKPVGQTHDA